MKRSTLWMRLGILFIVMALLLGIFQLALDTLDARGDAIAVLVAAVVFAVFVLVVIPRTLGLRKKPTDGSAP